MSANFKDIRWNAPIESQRSLQKTNRRAVAKRSFIARYFWPATAYLARRSVWIAVGFLMVPAKPGSVKYAAGCSQIVAAIKSASVSTATLIGQHVSAKLSEAKQNFTGIADDSETDSQSLAKFESR